DYFALGHTELVLPMNGRGCQKGVNAGMLGQTHALECGLDVLFGGASQPADDGGLARRPPFEQGGAHFARDGLNGSQVVGRSRRNTCLDDVDTEPRKTARHLELFLGGKRCAWRLFAVTKSRVEHANVV